MNKFKTIIFVILIILLALGFCIGITIFFISTYMKKISISNLYYDKGIDIIPNSDYIVVPGAQINENHPRAYAKTSSRLCLYAIFCQQGT